MLVELINEHNLSPTFASPESALPTHPHVCVHAHTCTHMCTHTHAHTCTHTCTHMCIHTHAVTHAHSHLHTHALTHAHTCTHVHSQCTHTCVHTCTHTRALMCTHSSKHKRKISTLELQRAEFSPWLCHQLPLEAQVGPVLHLSPGWWVWNMLYFQSTF